VPEKPATKPGPPAGRTYPKLLLKLPDGRTFVGAFTLPANKTPEVTVTKEPAVTATQPART
jgi:hypothetical protein